MADEENVDKKTNEKVEKAPNQKDEVKNSLSKEDELNDDLAEALGSEEESSGSSETEIDIDAFIAGEDPEFAKNLEGISASDFSELKINPLEQSEEVSEEDKVPSVYRSYFNNLPKEVKKRYYLSAGVSAVLLPIALLIYMGYLLPKFNLPFIVSMTEISNDFSEYPTDGVEVPLFDDFRSKSFTFSLPKTTINLKGNGEDPHYGEFEFFLNLRDKELAETIEQSQSEIIDLIQRTLEEVSLQELKSPMGKEKIKKTLRYRINDHLQGNHVLGIYYRSVLLSQ